MTREWIIDLRKKISLWLIAALLSMNILNPAVTQASAGEVTFHYVAIDQKGNYDIRMAVDQVDREAQTFQLATMGNAEIMDMYKIPEGSTLCGWQQVIICPESIGVNGQPEKPDLTATPSTPSEATPPNATPSDATPPNATPSEATPPDAEATPSIPSQPDEYGIYPTDQFFLPGQIVSFHDLMQYRNESNEIAFRPVFHDKALPEPLIEIDLMRDKVSYRLTFDRPVTLRYYTTAAMQPMTLDGGAIYKITVDRPEYGSEESLFFMAEEICSRCQTRIGLPGGIIEEIIPAMEKQPDHDSDPDTDIPAPPPQEQEPATPEDGAASDQSGNNRLPGEDLLGFTVQTSLPDRDGWYRSIPVLSVQKQENALIYYKLWNVSLGETEERALVRIYSGNSLPFDADGIYQIRMWSVSGDVRSPEKMDFTREFRVDRFAPVITVTYDNMDVQNNFFYNQKRTAVIMVNEGNFSEDLVTVEARNDKGMKEDIPLTWKHAGSHHTITVPFQDEGGNSLMVKAADMSGKTAEKPYIEYFHIDTTPPSLTITGVENLTANKAAVTPVITFHDDNIDMNRSSVILESISKDSKTEWIGNAERAEHGLQIKMESVNEDDTYILRADISDKAGNRTEKMLQFSVNQKGATFVFEPREIVGTYTNRSFYPEIEVWNTDEVTITSLTVNGQEAQYSYDGNRIRLDEAIEQDGKYTINLEVVDTAGNVSVMKTVEFIMDTKPPVNIVSGVAEGGIYPLNTTISIRTEQAEDTIQEIRLNGKPLSDNQYWLSSDGSMELHILEEGDYVLEVVSVDMAGNISDMKPITFSVTAELGEGIARAGTNWTGIFILLAGCLGLGAVYLWRRRRYLK